MELTVYGWMLPDVRDFGTTVSLLHCPESVARHYDDRGRPRSPIGFYVGFGNIHPSGRAFVAPGPNGAAPSPQLEAFREGLQVTEAILKLRAALADPQASAAIDAELAAEARAVIQILMDVMESNRRIRPAGPADVWPHIRRIYELVSEVALAQGT